ncbi:MAG: patatin-like phospholipase family protein [Anaerolineae bacterium]|nr:patatin-like phospholipase family protein [Anaerolineae bacterium]
MSNVDLVFEGGGAKGAVFTGALKVLLDEHGHSPARLLGTSAGAITAVSLAAGYTPDEMLAALAEKDAAGKPVLASFLGTPEPFNEASIQKSAVRRLLADLDVPFIPDLAETRLDNWLAGELARNARARHLFSFVERGGWYSADPFVSWLEDRLDQPRPDGRARGYGRSTFGEFFQATGVELTLVTADTTAAQMLLLNHRTAPDLPVVWAARMSMSVPLLWQEVEWQEEWGFYHAWDPSTGDLRPLDVTGHAIVDGGLLSNFPIALFLADRPDVAAVVGPACTRNVLGLLIDETLKVPNRPTKPATSRFSIGGLRTLERLHRLLTTATAAHDNMAISAFARHVVRLPAGGYSTIQFDMDDDERRPLLDAGAAAMRAFLGQQTVLEGMPSGDEFTVGTAERALANNAALTLLGR